MGRFKDDDFGGNETRVKWNDTEEGAVFEGTYLGSKTIKGEEGDFEVHTIREDGGEVFDLPETQVLRDKLSQAGVRKGVYVGVKYLGKPKGKRYHNFAVAVVEDQETAEARKAERAKASAEVSVLMTTFLKFTEENDWEDETWHFWLQAEGNEKELNKFRDLLHATQAEEEYDLPFFLGGVEDEGVVDALVRNADMGYMKSHNKVTGTFTCPDSLGESFEQLYKGEIVAPFKK